MFKHLPIYKLKLSRRRPAVSFPNPTIQDVDEASRNGIHQPIVARPLPSDGEYEILSGEYQWFVAQHAMVEEVPVYVPPSLSDDVAAGLVQQDVSSSQQNPIEAALALRSLQHAKGWKVGELAAHIGQPRTGVSHLLRLLKLPPEVQAWIGEGRLTVGHGRALVGLEDATKQLALAREIIDRKLTVRETEAAAKTTDGHRQSRAPTRPDQPPQPSKDPAITHLEQALGEHICAPVTIDHREAGGGSLRIGYHDLDTLDGILERLGYQS